MEHFITTWGYLGIFLFTVVEACCIPVPSEICLGLGGALASGALISSGHHLVLGLVIVVGVAGEMVGSFLGYVIGRTGGRALVDRWGKYVLLSHQDLDRLQAWFDRRGAPTVLVARMVPVARCFVSFAAGVSEMAPAPFGIYSFVGVAVWVSALVSAGYALGGTWHSLTKGFGDATYVLAAIIVFGVALAIGHRARTLRARQALSAASELDRPTGASPIRADGRPR